jgi:hypothetical protein
MPDILGIILIGELVQMFLVHRGEIGELVQRLVEREPKQEVVHDEVEHRQEQCNVYVVQIVQ